MFIQNKYLKWYNSIIANANTRTLSGYKEKHHIIPKSLGGSDDKSNLVTLTAREHFICHYLLTKMTTGSSYHKMLRAFIMMKASNSNQYRYTSLLYQFTRKKFSNYQKINQTGKSNNNYGRKWMHNEALELSILVSSEAIEIMQHYDWVLGRVIDWKSFRCSNSKLKSIIEKKRIKVSTVIKKNYWKTTLEIYRNKFNLYDWPECIQRKRFITSMSKNAELLGFNFLAYDLEKEYLRVKTEIMSQKMLLKKVTSLAKYYKIAPHNMREILRIID